MSNTGHQSIWMNGDKVVELEPGDDWLAMVDNVRREFDEWETIEVKDGAGRVLYTENSEDG